MVCEGHVCCLERRNMERKLEKILRDAIEKQELAGGALLVQDVNGRSLCRLEAGMADREAGRAITENTIFRLYSMTKPVTAVAAMILLERGELCLQMPVGEYLPAFRGQKVWNGGKLEETHRPVLIRDLLQMTSGLTYDGQGSETERQTTRLLEALTDSLFTSHPWTTQEVAGRLGELPLLYQPGTSWKYGLSADVLGAVMEQIAEMPLADFMKKEIFDPLGMEDTGFYVPEEKQGRLAAAYENGPDGTLIRYTGCHLGIRNDMKVLPAFQSGGAGLASTLEDYGKFARMLLQNGRWENRQILSPRTVEYMTAGKLACCQQREFDQWVGMEGCSYGNLMRKMWDPERTMTLSSRGEYGWDGWLGCHFANCPEDGISIIFMQQKKGVGHVTDIVKIS